MTRVLTTALAGYDIHWWHVALGLVAAAIGGAVVFFAGRRWIWPTFRRWSTWQQVLAASATVLVMAGAAFALYKALERPGDVSNPDAAFHKEHKKPPPHKNKPQLVNWPVYGYDDARTRYLPSERVNPPFHSSDWSFQAGKLLEFSPIVVDKTLYFMDKDANFYALSADKGKVFWKHDIGSLNASSPAYSHGTLFAATLAPGEVVALGAEHGKVLWRHPLPGRTETSPVVYGDKVIVGCECGTVYALNKKTGKVEWSVPTGGAVKGGVALDNGVVFFGNYAGQLYAVQASNGDIKWQTGTQGGSFGVTGRIYSTPAVAYGRVYVGSIDSRVYSFEESSGDLAWSHSTGAEVYPGPAVADTPGAPPSVYVGSADKHVYAFDARSGALRWNNYVGGLVLGAPSVVGKVAYFGVIGPNTGTLGFSTKTGHRKYESDVGEYNPVISDGRHLYLTGASNLRRFTPLTPNEKHKIHERKLAKEKRQRRAHRRKLEQRRQKRHAKGQSHGHGGKRGDAAHNG
jgi:outer membrane protein assembly factor BamB